MGEQQLGGLNPDIRSLYSAVLYAARTLATHPNLYLSHSASTTAPANQNLWEARRRQCLALRAPDSSWTATPRQPQPSTERAQREHDPLQRNKSATRTSTKAEHALGLAIFQGTTRRTVAPRRAHQTSSLHRAPSPLCRVDPPPKERPTQPSRAGGGDSREEAAAVGTHARASGRLLLSFAVRVHRSGLCWSVLYAAKVLRRARLESRTNVREGNEESLASSQH